MSASLATAIDSLYAVFARVPRPSTIDHCACCFLAEDERVVLAPVPLRQLPADALWLYAANVMLTVGGTTDFRYFLPRLLEITSGEGFDWPSMEPLLGRLSFAEWGSWQDDERHAVQDFLAALWAHVLAGDPDAEDIDIVLCAIGNAEDDLTPYLAEWTSALTRPATRVAAVAQLRSLLTDGYRSDGNSRRLTNAFWRDRDSQAVQVVTWLSGTDLQVALFAAVDAADDEQTLQALADIDNLL